MTAWAYFTVVYSGEDPLDPAAARFGRRDPGGARYNCQMLHREGTWTDSERLRRYYVLGSNEDTLTDVTVDQARFLLDQAVARGRFAARPDEP